MAVKSAQNTVVGSYFQAALTQWVKVSGKKQNELAENIGIAPSALSSYLNGTRVPSLAQMEEIAFKIDQKLLNMLNEGQQIIEGDDHIENNNGTNENEIFSPEQRQAIEAFKVCIKYGGEAAEMLARQAKELARIKQGEEEFQNPSTRRLSKSA